MENREAAREKLQIAMDAVANVIDEVDSLANICDRFINDHKQAGFCLAEALVALERTRFHLRKRKRLARVDASIDTAMGGGKPA